MSLLRRGFAVELSALEQIGKPARERFEQLLALSTARAAGIAEDAACGDVLERAEARRHGANSAARVGIAEGLGDALASHQVRGDHHHQRGLDLAGVLDTRL